MTGNKLVTPNNYICMTSIRFRSLQCASIQWERPQCIPKKCRIIDGSVRNIVLKFATKISWPFLLWYGHWTPAAQPIWTYLKIFLNVDSSKKHIKILHDVLESFSNSLINFRQKRSLIVDQKTLVGNQHGIISKFETRIFRVLIRIRYETRMTLMTQNKSLRWNYCDCMWPIEMMFQIRFDSLFFHVLAGAIGNIENIENTVKQSIVFPWNAFLALRLGFL